MIDRLLCGRSIDNFNAPYFSEEAITGAEHYNQEASDLAVIFPPWHGGRYAVRALMKRLVTDHSVLEMQFHNRILEPDINRVLNSFKLIRDRVSEEIDSLVQARGYESVHLIGLSLGNVALSLVADEYRDYNQATLVVAGSDLALSVWDGVGAPYVRHEFAKKGVTRQHLAEKWANLAPIAYAKSFTGRNVESHISQKDKVIPSVYQRYMAYELKRSGAITSERFSRLGHVATLTRFCLKG